MSRKKLAERGANPEAGILKTAPQAASLQPLDRLPSFLLPAVEQNKSSLLEATESVCFVSQAGLNAPQTRVLGLHAGMGGAHRARASLFQVKCPLCAVAWSWQLERWAS